jgi:lactobin A/cerein 7B family class IIb bacteriocin
MASEIQDLTASELALIDGGKIPASYAIGFALIGAAAIATGGASLIFAGTFLLAADALVA